MNLAKVEGGAVDSVGAGRAGGGVSKCLPREWHELAQATVTMQSEC